MSIAAPLLWEPASNWQNIFQSIPTLHSVLKGLNDPSVAETRRENKNQEWGRGAVTLAFHCKK